MEKHKELSIFYTLMENTDYRDISIELGNSTNKITLVKLGDGTRMQIAYTNIRTIYTIFFKGVKVIEQEIDNDIKINHDVLAILDAMKKEVIEEFLSYDK